MPETPPDAGGRRSSVVLLIGLAAIAVVAAITTAVVAGGGDGEEAAPAGGSTSPAPTVEPLGPECENLHAGHGIAMWTATMADEMTAAGCPFPYDPFLPPMEGGEEDPSLAAPFEARMYSELWELLSAADLGLCKVTTLDEESVDGLAFGFRYVAGPPACPDVEGEVEMVVREYVTRAWRDANAHDGTGERTFVLGRWVIDVSPTAGDGSAAEAIAAELLAAEAAEVTGE